MATPTKSVFSVLLTGALCAGVTACNETTSDDTGTDDVEASEFSKELDFQAPWDNEDFDGALSDAIDSLDGKLSPEDKVNLIEQVPLMGDASACQIKGLIIGQYGPSQAEGDPGGYFHGSAHSELMSIGADPASSLSQLNGEWSSIIEGRGPVIDGSFTTENGDIGSIHGEYSMGGFFSSQTAFEATWNTDSSIDELQPQRNGIMRGTLRPFVEADGGMFVGLWSECAPMPVDLCPDGFDFLYDDDGWASCTTRDLKLPEATGLAPHCADVNDGYLGFKWDIGSAQSEYECPDGTSRIDNGDSREFCIWDDLQLPPQDVFPACERLMDGELGFRWRLAESPA